MRLVFACLAIIFLDSVLLYRVYHILPITELKRRARADDKKAQTVYRIASQGQQLDMFLMLLGMVSGAILLIWSARTAWWSAVLAIIIVSWLIFWLPNPKYGGWFWRFAGFQSRDIYLKRLYFLGPLMRAACKLVPQSTRPHVHTGLYDKEDLLDLLNVQNHQVDNRIPEHELKMAFGALTFGDKKVAEVMTPRKDIHFVLANELVGPTLMDELHKTKQLRFPVVKQIKKNIEPEVIGTLLLADIIGLDKEGSVSGVMRKGVYFINEDDDLRTCLDALTKTKAHLLIVVNHFEEIVGIISLEEVLDEIIGQPLAVDFSGYDDKEAVAGRGAPKN